MGEDAKENIYHSESRIVLYLVNDIFVFYTNPLIKLKQLLTVEDNKNTVKTFNKGEICIGRKKIIGNEM